MAHSKQEQSSASAAEKHGKTAARRRKRGVFASREKLEKAMMQAGFKTQAALARAIAENENIDLDKAPRDMVNKVFRGTKVDHHTIQRLASVLGVDAYTLYLSSAEIENPQAEPQASLDEKEALSEQFVSARLESAQSESIQPENAQVVSQSPPSWARISVMLVGLLFIISLVLWGGEQQISNESITADTISLESEPINIAIVGVSDVELPNIFPSLAAKLGKPINLRVSNIDQVVAEISPWQLADKLGVDYVMHFTSVKKGRYQGIFINLLNSRRKQLIYADVWNELALSEQADFISGKLSESLTKFFVKDANRATPSLPSLDKNAEISAVSEEAVMAYLEGVNELDRPSTMVYMNRALTYFNRALRHSPSFSKAQIGICKALVGLHIANKDKSLLNDAEIECRKAEQNAKHLSDYHVALGLLYRKQGKHELAEASLNKSMALFHDNVDAMINQAENYIVMANKLGDRAYFDKALALMDKAEQLVPSFWKPSFTKGRVYYFSGQPAEAINSFSYSVEADENYTNINNLASVNYCYGSIDVTKALYQRAVKLKYAPAVTYYQLGSIHSYFHEYDLASIQMDKYHQAIKHEGSEVQLEGWIGMADTYQQNGETDKARSAYLSAYQYIEQERLRDNNTMLIKINEIYVQIALKQLDGESLSSTEQQEFVERFLALEPKVTNPSLQLQMILGYIVLEAIPEARKLYQKLAPICKGFAQYPGLEILKPKNKT